MGCADDAPVPCACLHAPRRLKARAPSRQAEHGQGAAPCGNADPGKPRSPFGRISQSLKRRPESWPRELLEVVCTAGCSDIQGEGRM